MDTEEAGPRPRSSDRVGSQRRGGRRIGFFSALALVVLAAWAVWSWGFCRFYVSPGRMAIVTAKSGATMPPGQILARPGQKGVLRDVLGEGRHLLNPLVYDWEIVPAQYIPAGKIGIVTAFEGENLPPGEFLAEPGQKGMWRRVLGPGMYRFNPYGYSIDIIDATGIPMGFAGVVTNQSGAEAAVSGVGTDQRGIRPDILQPGLYYINPRRYKVEALEVGVNQLSLLGQQGDILRTKNVIVDENNQMMQLLNQNVLQEKERQRAASHIEAEASLFDSVMDDPGRGGRKLARGAAMPAPRGPRATDGVRVEMEKNVAPEYTLRQFVNFPSRDAFNIALAMTVEFELHPRDLAGIRSRVGSLPEVVAIKIEPAILGWARSKGSDYRAVDFIAGEGKERFQNDLTHSLKTILGNENIIIHSALVSTVIVPEQILEPFRVTSLSRQTDLTNQEKQNTAKKQADLNSEISLIAQAGQQVAQETAKMKAQIQAEMERTVATIQAETTKRLAAIDKETAERSAAKTIALGRATTESTRMVEEEKAKGFGMKVAAFDRAGDGDYALYEFANRLNPDLKIRLIHAGEGTLWTDLKHPTFAELGAAGSR